jgi:hypothetical protein
MPYANKEDQKACYARWREKNPDRYKHHYEKQNAKKETVRPRQTAEEKIARAEKAVADATARLAILTQKSAAKLILETPNPE